MSIKAMTWAWEMQVKGNQKLVLLALADHADDSGQCWPGLEGLSEKCGIDRSTIIAHIQELESLNYLSKKRSYDENGYRKPNVYMLNLGKKEEKEIVQSGEIQHRENQSSEFLSRKSLRGDFPKSKVGNSDPNIINRQKATVSILKKEKIKKEKKLNYLGNEFFEIFWQSYPLKKSKGAAIKAFQKINPSREKLNDILHAISDQHTERILAQRHRAFVPEWKHPATWLNQKCWEDEVKLRDEDWSNANQRQNNPIRESATQRIRRELTDAERPRIINPLFEDEPKRIGHDP